MSLTNPNTPVSQQDLKDFYDKIKPYMGLYPSAMGKKIGKGDIYSTEERLIGQWIDGKPLYKTTRYFGTGNTANTLKKVAHNIANIAMIVKVEGLNVGGDAKKTGGSLPWVDMTNYLASLWADETDMVFRSNYDSTSITYYATIYYTKTTDSATSIGDETDYSTTEKIVGTWIDGKPLYQKVIVKENFQIVNDASFAHGIANVDKIFIKEGFLDDNGSFVMIPLLWSTSYNGVLIDATNIVFKGNGVWGADVTRTLYFVVQYTKTTS